MNAPAPLRAVTERWIVQVGSQDVPRERLECGHEHAPPWDPVYGVRFARRRRCEACRRLRP